MSTVIEHLAARIGDSLGPRSANMPPWLWRPLLRLLALCEPVTAADLAQVTGRTLQDVQQALATLPDTEYDEQGRIIGHGITLRPTSIRTAFCNQVHFFASPAAAQPWLDQHLGATVLTVGEAFASAGRSPRRCSPPTARSAAAEPAATTDWWERQATANSRRASLTPQMMRQHLMRRRERDDHRLRRDRDRRRSRG
jgi:hypothetical protein